MASDPHVEVGKLPLWAGQDARISGWVEVIQRVGCDLLNFTGGEDTVWRPSGIGCASRRRARRASAALFPVGVEGAIMARITYDGALPIAALIAKAQRELDLRRQYYWARVRTGQMRQTNAVQRIALVAAIVKRLTVTAAL